MFFRKVLKDGAEGVEMLPVTVSSGCYLRKRLYPQKKSQTKTLLTPKSHCPESLPPLHTLSLDSTHSHTPLFSLSLPCKCLSFLCSYQGKVINKRDKREWIESLIEWWTRWGSSRPSILLKTQVSVDSWWSNLIPKGTLQRSLLQIWSSFLALDS